MRSFNLFVGGLATASLSSAQKPLVSEHGQTASIPNWDVQSSAEVDNDPASVSKTDFDVSSWYHADVSRCELMACLINAGVYNDQDLFYADNLEQVDRDQFLVPWYYRNAFDLPAKDGQHYILQTNGITSRADLFLNGKQFATKDSQSGAYGGHTYDVTDLVDEHNALVVQAYPTNVKYDLAIGFVDWNPQSPANGTGVWRDITIKQTGPVSLSKLSVAVDIDTPVESSPATIRMRTMARNLEDREIEVHFGGSISEKGGDNVGSGKDSVTLGPHETRMLEIEQTIDQPKVWWPKTWGAQPLYDAEFSVSVDSYTSDAVQHSFGVRKATYEVNDYEDGIFHVNGYPFQVVGGGYSADMFLRWDDARFETIVQYMLDLGQNTIRLEGKMEQPALYEIADQYGLMVMAGWECCDKWEAWEYNDNVSPNPLWDDGDYETANASMWHEALMMQPHPSILGFLVGSDFWPNDRATKLYLNAFDGVSWQAGIIASAAKRGYPEAIGPSGMKMDGPYDWVPPNYWWDNEGSDDRLGSSFGFGSELGPGVGTPEMGSLKQFLNESDLEVLWKEPAKKMFHMSTGSSAFNNREIYNEGLFNRYGEPKSLEDYLLKAQMMDYEATRAEYEGYSAFWSADRPSTGLIYWMLNNAWPSLHWNQFDYYMHPGGSYFGSKTGSRIEHVAFDNVRKSVWLINHSLDREGSRKVSVELIDMEGKTLSSNTIDVKTAANTASNVGDVSGIDDISGVAFLKLVLSDDNGKILSRNVYWVSSSVDKLDWADSTWYHTPVSDFVDFTALSEMKEAEVDVRAGKTCQPAQPGSQSRIVTLENKSDHPAFFVRLNLVDADGSDVTPVMWSDNYVTLWPHEKLRVKVTHWQGEGAVVNVDGGNVAASSLKL